MVAKIYHGIPVRRLSGGSINIKLTLDEIYQMIIKLYDKSIADGFAKQVIDIAKSCATDLLIEGIPSDNGFYPWYQWGLSKEIEHYLVNIGKPKSGTEILLAFENEDLIKVIGFLLFTPSKKMFIKECSVHYLAVDSDFCGKGIGTELLKTLLEKSPQVDLTCFPSKVEFYKKRGFKPIDTYHTQVMMTNTGKPVSSRISVFDRGQLMSSPEGRRNQIIVEQSLGHIGSLNAMKGIQSHMSKLMENIEFFRFNSLT